MVEFNARGEEIPDPTPMAIPAGIRRPEPLNDIIRRLIQTELSQLADAQGFETEEEADDFDVEDPYDEEEMLSPYEFKELQDDVEYPGGDGIAGESDKPDQDKVGADGESTGDADAAENGRAEESHTVGRRAAARTEAGKEGK